MQIILDVLEDGMVSIDGGEPMPAADAMMELDQMINGEGMGEAEMWEEEAAMRDIPEDEMMGDM